jgi:hypothetical protein
MIDLCVTNINFLLMTKITVTQKLKIDVAIKSRGIKKAIIEKKKSDKAIPQIKTFKTEQPLLKKVFLKTDPTVKNTAHK